MRGWGEGRGGLGSPKGVKKGYFRMVSGVGLLGKNCLSDQHGKRGLRKCSEKKREEQRGKLGRNPSKGKWETPMGRGKGKGNEKNQRDHPKSITLTRKKKILGHWLGEKTPRREKGKQGSGGGEGVQYKDKRKGFVGRKK